MIKPDTKLIDAYGVLVEANLPRLRAIARSYSDMQSTEDLVQEMLYQLWRSFPSFRGESQLDTWVYRVALNTAITWLDGTKRRPQIVSNSEDRLVEPVSMETVPVDTMELLENFMKSLNSIDRAVMILYLDDRSYEEIAERFFTCSFY